MIRNYKNQLMAAAWVVAVLLVAAVTGLVTGIGGWLLTAIVALGPAISLLHFSKELPQTTSESINHARR